MSKALIGSDIPGTLLLDPYVLEDPYPFYERLRVEAPMWRVPGTKVFAATSYEMVTEILARTDDFSNNLTTLLYLGEDGLPQQFDFGDATIRALASADPPSHTTHRKTVFPELVAKRMTALSPWIEDFSEGLIDELVQGGGGDFMAAVGNPVPLSVISKLIGFRNADPAMLMQGATDGTTVVGATQSLELLTPAIERSLALGEWITEQMASPEPGEDTLLGTISQGVANDVLLHEEGVAILQMLLSAGGESTTSLLGNAVRILAEDPSLQSTLRADLSLIPTFVEEALRLESPFRMQMRSVPHDTDIQGVEVPAGATICVFFSAANRDPGAFDNPNAVDLKRDAPRVHLAFGRGVHFCVGAHLARVEAAVVITSMLRRTSSIQLDPARAPVRVRSLLARRHESLPVTVAH